MSVTNNQAMSAKEPTDSISKRVLFYYGAMGFPLAMLGIPVYLYLPQFYADNFGLSLSAIGLALLAARLFDVVTDPLIGWLSDYFEARFSRAKQILAGLVMLILALYFLFFPAVEQLSFSYIFWASFFTYLAWTIVQVPYQTMVAEISYQPLHKTQLTSAREAMAILGVLFILIVPFALGLKTNQADFYLLFLFSAGIFLLLAGLVLCKVHPLAHTNPTQQTKPTSIINNIKQLWQNNRAVFSIMPAYFLNNLANAIPATLFVFFVSDYLNLEQYTGLFLLLYFLAGLVALPVWIKLSKHIGKEKTWQASMLMASLFFGLVFLLEPHQFWFFILITVLTGFSLGIDLAIPASIQADMSQQVQNASEVKGLIFGIWGMLTKLALAVGVGISLPVLDWLKETTHFEIGILILYAGVAIALKIIAIFWVRKVYFN